jgi:drug/metabolite transporter (DMT)-like permease
MNVLANRGVVAALSAAVLFGAGTPAVKMLLEHASPWLMAGILYLGSGIGLLIYRLITKAPAVALKRHEMGWLAAAVIAGGMMGPLLLMTGLSGMAATDASLLLNAEGVLTAVLAWFVFKENFDRRIALGMVAIVAGAVVLSWPSQTSTASLWPTLAVLGACLSWAIDNNLTRKVSIADASFIAMMKGLAAGATNLLLALATGAVWPSPGVVAWGGDWLPELWHELGLVRDRLALSGYSSHRGVFLHRAVFWSRAGHCFLGRACIASIARCWRFDGYRGLATPY